MSKTKYALYHIYVLKQSSQKNKIANYIALIDFLYTFTKSKTKYALYHMYVLKQSFQI